MMKFLICGLGSIGQRHIRMIRKHLGEDADIAALRLRNLDIVITDKLEASFGTSPEEHYGLRCFHKIDEAMAWKPDMVFVTNPISMHVDTAIEAAKAGCNIFIEKPLSHNVGRVDELQRVVTEKNLKCMVGYQLRYHPAYQHIKTMLQNRTIGKLISADLHFGEWLPGMHPYEDYRESHAARSDQGGGVILCLSHEIDIACWLFGKPERVHTVGGHLSDLEMDVEDTADITLTCRDEKNPLPVHIHLDFLQKPARRYIHIVGDKGAITFDYCTSELRTSQLPEGKVELTRYDQFQRNDMFLGEVGDFIECVRRNKPNPLSLSEGRIALDICLAARKSLQTGHVVDIER
jgi:predicted dehydrogenase